MKLNQEGNKQNVKHKMSTFVIASKMNKSDKTAQKKKQTLQIKREIKE